MIRAIALDPGDVTGWSTWCLPSLGESNGPMERTRFGVMPGGVQGFIYEAMFEFNGFRDFDIVVCESFALDGRTRFPDLTPKEIEGALRAMLASNGKPEPFFQPNQLKSLAPDSLLKEFGLWIENDEVDWEDSRDVNDSQIHMLAWAFTHNHKPTVERYWPDV